jgi:hypothetical protein
VTATELANADAATLTAIGRALSISSALHRIDLTEEQHAKLLWLRSESFGAVSVTPFVPGDVLRTVLEGWPSWCLRDLLDGIRYRPASSTVAISVLKDSIIAAIRVAEAREVSK